MDNDKSGATLAWDYFSKDKPFIKDPQRRSELERLYAHIQDVDLWTFYLPGSKEFKVGMGVKGIEWNIEKNQSLFLQLQTFSVENLIEKGTKGMNSTFAVIEADLENTFPIYLGGKDSGHGSCLAVFTIHPQFRSDMGHLLAEKSQAMGLRGIGAICYVAQDDSSNSNNKAKNASKAKENSDGVTTTPITTEAETETPTPAPPSVYKVSLRSIDDEDTSVISRCFQGGGHKNASSFNLPVDTWQQWQHRSAAN
eukprot:TRINITY_DN4365_c0_g1_i2.p1 TRINITY_DN4365_c0_g1~~TRINITY_DN4365_c0_g1_i2.p1  ORF type:complete len:253 (+),score=59.02 TRINITY_DN4365_c0_g1_i2:114-872(+)